MRHVDRPVGVEHRQVDHALVVVAAPGVPRPTDAAVPVVVRGADAAAAWWVSAPGGPAEMMVNPVLRLSSMVMIRDAVRAGGGAARLPLSLVGGDIAEGRLAHWGDVAGSDIALWVLYPSRRLLNARVAAFLEFLRRSFPAGAPEELAAYIEG